VRKNHEAKIQRLELKLIRDYTHTDHQLSTEIRNELKVFSVTIRIQNYSSTIYKEWKPVEYPQGNRSLG
jgi:flagellar biosynthesis regulator FlaF